MFRSITTFSGGEKARLVLATIIRQAPNLLLLDEPTNHLDLDSSEWLGKYILENIPSLIVISHDRYFLNEFIDEVCKI